MSEFVSWRDYWIFASDVIQKRRFLRTDRGEAFLAAVTESSKKRVNLMPAGTELWRAQRGCNYAPDSDSGTERPVPFPAERMKPLADRAQEGRVNPKGIACLYLANGPDTAISETRAGIGERVSLANFRTKADSRLVDCIHQQEEPLYLDEPDSASKERAVWSYMNRAFSSPVGRAEDRADYAPTQVLAEVFKGLGFDGIIYRSAFGTDGYNLALFDLDSADPVGRWVYRVDDVAYKVSIDR
ncbi:RES family NAD+ phosphorylase [Devosia sp. BSSL-BM10]|uniref:RES family NAD+ phosphorylase n=1 Tax=Devosia litorisediminis TaxID=2829817 RepID=A0A942E8Q4_9HYPH|nr:RES family NAD+ phosphorylase [Devosia litorisediminis]MBS3850160.1 RES family NAD+ phosphorylase [Devosia litorisediminis]